MNSLWDILSVAIGISFIFMILSILNSWIQDYIAAVFHLRANNLADIMQNLLEPGALSLNGSERAREKLPENTETNTKQTQGRASYKVKKGETLSRIASDQQVSIADLRNANLPVLDRLPLKVGDTLKIPERSYTVPASGTISLIMDQVGASFANLKWAKPTAPPNASLQDGKPATIPNAPQTSTLKSIGEKLEVPIDTLRNANPELSEEQPMQEGISLKIPEGSHNVQSDDTLSKMAEKYEISIADLRNANLPVLDELPLPAGLRLKFPKPKAEPYTVQRGDTLSNISKKFGVSIEDLQAKNPGVRALPNDPLTRETTLEIPRARISQMVSRKNVSRQLIENPVRTLYTYPGIHSLSRPGELPDRIPTKDFTSAVLDLLDDLGRTGGKKSADKIQMDSIIDGIKKLEKEAGNRHPLAFRLRSLLYTAQINTQITRGQDGVEASIDEFQKAISGWFDDTVARGSVWYKRRMQRIGIVCGFLLAIVLNADTIGLSNALWHNAMLRESVLQAAQASAAQEQAASGEQAQQQLDALTTLGLPLGWSFRGDPADPRSLPSGLEGWIGKIVGLLVTGFAISQGSQLWFDLMNRLLNVRSSALQPASEEQPVKDRTK